ncbi:ankyrin [Morchella conica CCBAS932]|uniref:Ankyrin n=1 Tax=Morchella conica CCBAS932 TaxID=1392247 RepID=A0A3N4KN11_9PEZI|nr:ankyrin [Morchella conica CCBAS932]
MLDEQSYFVQAVRKGDTWLVRHYLNDGHDINSVSQGWSAVSSAVIKDDMDMVLLLLYDGVDVEREDLYGNTPLQLASPVSKGLDQLSMRLIELGAPIDRRDEMGSTVLHVAAAAGDPYIVKLLLMYGWNRNAKDNNGRTALIHAIRAGNHEVSKALCSPMEHTDRLYIPLHQLTACFD